MTTDLPYEKHTKTLLGMKRYKEAQLVCVKWVEKQPENPIAWFLKAFAETNAHMLNRALISIDRGLKLNPDHPLMLVQRAQILGAIGHSQECLDTVDHLLSGKPLPPAVLQQVGATLNNIGEHQRAVSLFEQVRKAEPANAANLSSLATACHILGRSEEASEIQREAIGIAPEEFRSYWLLGQMSKAVPEANHVEFFTDALDRHRDKLLARVCLNFALAKQYEELEQYEAAFEHLAEGSVAVLEHSPYDQARDEQIHQQILRAFDEPFCGRDIPGFNDASPIFIVGMPRTGTTLLEQILTTYDEISTAGELHHFPHLFSQACNKLNPGAGIDGIYAGLERLDWPQLGTQYIKAARLHVDDSPWFIDKYPLNFTMVGPILKALPDARIINLTRNPMDTCFSNYKLLYRLGTALHSYDLLTMGEYYIRYQGMMSHWHRCYPGRILDVSYEALVTESVDITRAVTDYLDLEWRADCLEFYRQGGAVATASTTQVRQPINTGSLHKWRKFEHQLAPLTRFFEVRGITL